MLNENENWSLRSSRCVTKLRIRTKKEKMLNEEDGKCKDIKVLVKVLVLVLV